jgi:hypothetical protein
LLSELSGDFTPDAVGDIRFATREGHHPHTVERLCVRQAGEDLSSVLGVFGEQS